MFGRVNQVVLLALLCVCILSYANAQTHARVPISRELVAETFAPPERR